MDAAGYCVHPIGCGEPRRIAALRSSEKIVPAVPVGLGETDLGFRSSPRQLA
jgi:HrpA-like RNA helicase